MSADNEDDDIDELEYEGNLPALEIIEADVGSAWAEAWRTDANLRELFGVLSGGQDPPPPPPFSFDRSQTADPLTVTLIVIVAHAAAGVSKRVVLDIWRKILLPKLERSSWGDGAAREVPRRRRRKP